MLWLMWVKKGKAAGLLSLIALTLVRPVSLLAQDPPPDARLQLTKIEFEGLQTQTRDKMIITSELQIGQMVDMATIKIAAQRLSQTGLFAKVAYRYRFSSTIIELTFELEEKTAGKRPCQFDNFVWFTDQELKEAIKRDWPDFDGTMPVSDFLGEEIKKSLTRLMRERKIAGEISYEVDESLAYMFKVKDASLKVCGAQFIGARVELIKPLLDALRPLLKTEYSKSEVRLYVRAALIPVYRERGFLKASFQQAEAALSSSGDCANAVVLKLPVEEGLQYRWDKAVWAGNQAFTAQQLDKGLKLKQGDVANEMMIEAGWSEVSRIYGSRGYLKVRLKPEQSFDDARQLVSFQVAVTEGPQYRMGEMIISGLDENDIKQLRESWQLKPGETFDSTYAGIFLSKIRREGPVKFKDVRPDYKLDDEKLTVDLLLKFDQ